MSVKRELVMGTLILTAAGLMARLLGLYNRIYLANLISNAELGRYQLIFPVFMLCMAICSSGVQVAVSKMVSAYHASGMRREIKRTMALALAWSLGLALICSAVIYIYAGVISLRILGDAACTPYLRIMAAAIPFAAAHNCISGYFYGLSQTAVPAMAQLLEQIARVGCIFGISVWVYGSHPPDASIAVWGLVAGESVSSLVTLVCYRMNMGRAGRLPAAVLSLGNIFRQLWNYTGLLTVNRISVTLLQSAEMILIPMMLTRYCGDANLSLELFGVMTGIVMPVITFPNTVTNALSTLMLPTVSEADAMHNYGVITDTVEKSIRYCLMMGIFATFLFALYGGEIGDFLFNDDEAGVYIRLFAILCPLMYIQSLLASTLNGLGKMNETLMHHVIASGIRIGGILLLVPEWGVQGYIIGIFAANGVVTLIAALRLHQLAGICMHPLKDLLLPACGGVFSALVSLWAGALFGPASSGFWRLFWQCAMMGLVYMGMMLPFSDIKRK